MVFVYDVVHCAIGGERIIFQHVEPSRYSGSGEGFNSLGKDKRSKFNGYIMSVCILRVFCAVVLEMRPLAGVDVTLLGTQISSTMCAEICINISWTDDQKLE